MKINRSQYTYFLLPTFGISVYRGNVWLLIGFWRFEIIFKITYLCKKH